MASLAVKERISSAKFNKKRSREPEGPEPSNLLSQGFDSSSSSSPSGSKSSKGGEKARRLSFSLTPESAGSRDLPDLNHTLPMYTAELGSLEFPFYGQFHFADPIQTGSAPVIPSSDTDTTGSDPRLPSAVTGNINLDSLMFDHFTKEAVEAAGIPQIPPTADTYVIDALFHGHGQPQPQTQTQSILSMTGSSQELPPICHLPPCLHIVQDYRMSSSLDEWPTNFLNTVAEPQARIGGGTMLAFSTFSYYMSHWHIFELI